MKKLAAGLKTEHSLVAFYHLDFIYWIIAQLGNSNYYYTLAVKGDWLCDGKFVVQTLTRSSFQLEWRSENFDINF